MKKIYSILFCILGLHVNTQAQWVKIMPPSYDDYTSVYFPTKDTGYILGLNGNIIKTVDARNNCVIQIQNSSTFTTLSNICFTDANKGFVVGANGIVLKTTNGGIKWDTITALLSANNGNNSYVSVCFPTKSTGYILTEGTNSNYKTTDGGNTWIAQPNSVYGTGFNSTIYFTYSVIGYMASYGGILKTIDGGNTWIRKDSSESFSSIYFSTPDTGYAAAQYGSIYKTVNAGNNWFKQLTNVGATDNYSIFFTSTNIGYVVGINSTTNSPNRVLKTTDGGINWVQQTTPGNNLRLYSVFFTNQNTGYVVGFGNTIFKTTNGGFTDINEVHSLNNSINIYPNPTNNKITIDAND